MAASPLRIGTRGSALALWQANWVKRRLLDSRPDAIIELVIIQTKGDKIQDVPLAQVGGKGLFVKELEEALLRHEVDLAVHSMKDVPSHLPEGLCLGAILEREDPRDALLSIHHHTLAALPEGAVVGSSSLRRQSQLRHLRPDLRVVSLRGNVTTRIDKLKAGALDAILLAAAGVKRLGLTEHVVAWLEPYIMIPANGQGAIGIEVRADPVSLDRIAFLTHLPTWQCVTAERAFLATLEGGCQVPIAGYAQLIGERLRMVGRVASLDGSEMLTHRLEGVATDPEALGRRLAQHLIEQGARPLLQKAFQEGISAS